MSTVLPGPALLSTSTVAAAGGTTPVGTTGITVTQIAYGATAPNTIKGSSELVFVEASSVKVANTVVAGIQLYNTADQTTNYERLELLWSSNNARLRTIVGGSGTNRALILSAGAGASQTFRTSGSANGIFEFSSISTSVAGAVSWNFTNFTSTATSGSTVGILLTPTYNQSSGTAANTDLKITRTQTAVGSGAQFLIQAGTSASDSLFTVSNTGVVALSNTVAAAVAVASTHKVTMVIGGVTYYLLATNVA